MINRFRLWVHTISGEQASFTLPQNISGLKFDKLVSEKYQPGSPENLEIVETLYALVVSWSPSHCVQFYYLSYRRLLTNIWKSEQVQVSDKPSVYLTDDVDTCTEYEVKLISAIGEKSDSYCFHHYFLQH